VTEAEHRPSIPESHRDLLGSPVATLATIGPDGRPQLSAVWFLADGGTGDGGDGGTETPVRLSLNSSRQKVRNLQRNAACTVFLLDLTNPYRYLEIRGDAELTPDDDYAFADQVGAKYGADLRTMDRPGERRFVVTLRPTRINAVDLSA
jgi:PPOX class probable F420-dependent enzyme